MRSSADDIPQWLASLSDRALRRLYSRLSYLLRMIDVEMHIRNHRCGDTDNDIDTSSKKH